MWKQIISGTIFAAGAVTMFACFAPAAESLKIGMVATLSGPGAESGRFQGTELAIDEVNKGGGVLGRQIELIMEDDQSTNSGGLRAFRKLAAYEDIPALIGPIRSTEIHAIAQDIQNLGKPVMIGGTDPDLTHMGNPWLFRFRPNDTYSARAIGDYGVMTLGKKTWAIVHSTDEFGTSGMKALIKVLNGMGVKLVLVRGYTNTRPWEDATIGALRIKESGADVIGTFMTFEFDLSVLAKTFREGGVQIPWVGSATTAAVTSLKLAGPALYGSYAAVDFNRESSTAAKEFAARYEAAYKSAPDYFAAWAYDAVHVLALAINNAQSLDAQKIREAILSVKGYQGAEGTYNFEQDGDALHGYNIVRNDNGRIVLVKHVEFAE